MAASTVGVNFIHPGAEDPLLDHNRGQWLTDLGMCAALAVVIVILLAVRLSRLDPHRKAHK
jgi:hypothetical protein